MDYVSHLGNARSKAVRAGAIFAIIALFALVISGCINQSGSQPSALPTGQPTAASATPSPVPTPTVIATATAVPSIIGDNKTGVDKVNQTIASILPDGSYSGDETYAYHSGVETVTFAINVSQDIVTGVNVTSHNPNPWSGRIINSFAAALPDLVVGKKINELNLPVNVGGSSLTNAAFKKYVGELIASHPAA